METLSAQERDDFETRASYRGHEQSGMTVRSIPEPLYAVSVCDQYYPGGPDQDVRFISSSLEEVIKWCSGDPVVPFGSAKRRISEFQYVKIVRLAPGEIPPPIVWIHKNPAGEQGEPAQ